MSRASLWHQEKNIKRRSKEAEEAWERAVEDGRNNRARNLVPSWGAEDTFRLEPMLMSNIKKDPYFVRLCQEVMDVTALIDQIYYDVEEKEQCIQPWTIGGGKTPSKAFCLLLRLLTMRCTINQMSLMLNHGDSPYIRAIGFLYLRYGCDPTQMFAWMKPYLFDEEPIQITSNKKGVRGPRASNEDTIGSLVRSLLSSNRDFHGTMLPRLPTQVEMDVQVQMLQAEKVQARAERHFRDARTMERFQRLGSKVMATYEDEENPLQWYEAEVDRVITRGEGGHPLKFPKFVVTFTEYGNTETVFLGEMDVPGGRFVTEDQKAGPGGGRVGTRDGIQYDNRREALYDEVKRREREKTTASGRYYSRPHGGGVTLATKDERSRPPDSPPSYRKRSPPRGNGRSHHQSNHSLDRDGPMPDMAPQNPPPRKRTAEELAAIQEKKRKLMAKYG